MKQTGKILQILPLQQGMGRNGEWKKQSYILEYSNGKFPKKMMFTLWGDKIQEAKIQENQSVTVDFDIECQEYNGRFYNDVRAWRVSLAENQSDDNSFSAPAEPANDDFPF